jgi:gliding motility-associated-like protein
MYESKPRKSFIVNVLPLLPAAITGDSVRTFCYGSAILTAENPGAGAKISWFSDGLQVGGDSLSFRPTTSGIYHIRVENDSCIYFSKNVQVNILPKPLAEIIEGENILICDEGYIFARTSEGATYSWLNESNSVIGTGEKLKITTDIRVRLRVSLNGCLSTTSVANVRFRTTPENPEPYSNKSLICEGESLVLTTKKNQTADFFWTSPTGTRYEGREAVIKHADSLASGAYILTTNRDGCKRFDTLFIKFSPIINFLAEVKNPVCFDGNDGLIKIHSVSGAILKATVGTKTLSGTQFIFDNLSKGVYEVLLENEDKCQRKLIFTLANPPKPVAEAGDDLTTSVFLPVNLNAEGSGELYIWSPEEGLSANNIPNPTANPKQSTLYTLRIIDEKGCEASDSVWVYVITELIPPKILSPNEDKNNDLWAIENLEYFPDNEVTIWNRWGQEVFYEKNYKNKWDGTKDGQKLPEGAYYFLIKIAGGEVKKAGTVNILR